jgi:hypothetical protein
MKKIIKTYNEHKLSIHFYLKGVINHFKTDKNDLNSLQHIINTDKSIEIIYFVNNDYQQITPSIFRNFMDNDRIGVDKSYYFNIINFTKETIQISNPYLHYNTGRPTLTLTKKEDNGYIVIDFDLIRLLEELRLIDHNSLFYKINSTIVSSSGFILGLVSLFLIFYGIYIFINMLFYWNAEEVFHKIFSSIISITIGIAIYDLAKTFIEQEVIFNKMNYSSISQSDILIKFLNSIIIALSIESLMAVFKIVLSNPEHMINAFYLILGDTLLILGTGLYIFLSRYNKK